MPMSEKEILNLFTRSCKIAVAKKVLDIEANIKGVSLLTDNYCSTSDKPNP